MTQSPQSGRIELVIGPMFAGKTTELMSRVNRYSLAGYSCYVIEYSKHERYSKKIFSPQHRLSMITTVSVTKLSEVGNAWHDYDVIAVDEGQFFPDILEFCSMAANAGKKVIVAALDGDYRNEPFENIAKLIPAAESVTKLSAVCMSCRVSNAYYTHRTVQSEQRELIGGADKYEATCRACYNRLNNQGGSLVENPQIQQSGRIELVIGPMFAGKTTELISRVNRNYLASHSCYVIEYSKNMRYSRENIPTHDGRTLPATVSVNKLSEVGNAWHDYDVIAVDGGQFFPDILEFCSMAANAGKKVIVAALDGDYRNEPFEHIAKLIPAAESVTKLSAVCMSCGCDAYYTHRTVQSEQRELIGGAEKYEATCRACYNRLNNQGGSLVENPQIQQSGRIELVIGPMFAGKTTELISRVNRNYLARYSCYVIEYSKDMRYSKEIIPTYDRRTLPATVSVNKLSEVGNAWHDYDVIAVDEGQFFPDILEFCSMVANAGKKVIVAALDGDYRNEPFEHIAKLIPAAESVTKLSAVCMSCRLSNAYYTHRIVQSEQRELIGGADMYIAACRACYNRLNSQGGSLAENPQSPQSGRIELVIGPMFAGKTTELISRVNRNYLARYSCYVIEYSKDMRYSKEIISTYDRRTLPATVSVNKLSEVGNAWHDYDVIAVDEGQFFPDILEFCSMAANAGKKVIVAALDGDYRNEPFEHIAKLIPAAESVTKLSAVCMSCGCDAHYTHRTVQSEQRELIGGADIYIATCRACYNRLNNQGGSLVENPKGPQSGVAVSHTVEDANEFRSAGADVASVDAPCRDSVGSRTATPQSSPNSKTLRKRQRSPSESPSSPVDEKPVRKLC
uniref:thymidine kinase n=1 Tax=Trypanosoma congolense (strain IL3000) TaxID=1068625 RepID=G0UVA0_TRYCI|nr:unnamed protein product [Trypanosoma congolense IL3000]